MADGDEFEATAHDYGLHGFTVLLGCVCLAVLSPIVVPLYVIGRFSARWWPVADRADDYSSADGYW